MIHPQTHSNMYGLQRYGGMRTKHTCPSCGRAKCFVYYVNEDGKALHPSVGRCDHESKCGYHYKPNEFFRDHPDLKCPDSWAKPMEKVERKLWTIREDEVRRFRSDESIFCKWLIGIFGSKAKYVANEYGLGATADGSAVFWQIDIAGRVHTGKVMAYDETGHRIKNPDCDRITWMHTLLKMDGILPAEFDMTQCFFGEHLLNIYPDKTVAIVESEKTALIMSIVNTEYLWLASGGKNALNGDKMTALQGRKILLFPDADAIDDWKRLAGQFSRLYDVRVCVPSYTPEDIISKRDIADLILQQL